MSTVTRELEAFMDAPDAPKPNRIHSTGGAREYGFSGALVGGVTAYGWCVGSIVAALGPSWLDAGWVSLVFKRPMYPGDRLRVSIGEEGRLCVERGSDVCFEGHVGLGTAPWFGDLRRPREGAPRPAQASLPQLTLTNAPVGRDLVPMAASLAPEDARTFARERERETLECFYGDEPRVHPAWLAEQPIRLLHHTFDYGPSIHARSLIQHLSPAFAGSFVVGGHCVTAYTRGGHDYIENDCVITSASGPTVARLRHVSIFRIGRRAPERA